MGGGVRIGSLCSGYSGLDLAAMQHFGGTLAWVADGVVPQQAALALRLLDRVAVAA